jgi:anhydro-N-acetylmuramic acid kinase
MRVAGIMSGTSLDGIDVAIVDLSGKRIKTVAHSTTPYTDDLRTRILAVSNTRCETRDISRLNFELGEAYARAVLALCKSAKVAAKSIELIGCHGQTIYHEGSGDTPNTLQIGEAAVIAERVGVPVVSNFRTRDMAAGGQGAPLVPFLDYLLFGGSRVNRVSVNVGGIGNLTILPKNAGPEKSVAFDTGPGNMVIDQLVERLSGGKLRFDRGGAIAARAQVNRKLLDELLEDPYFRAAPPKSVGREQYGQEFVDRMVASGDSLENLIATATAFTPATIAFAIRKFAPKTREVIVAGGGVHNAQLMAQLAALLPKAQVRRIDEFGIDGDAKEAIAFAVMAWRTWRRKTANLPSATGARHPVVLGSITP